MHLPQVRPTPERGEGVITTGLGSPAEAMPSVVNALLKYHLGCYAWLTGSAGTLKKPANVGAASPLMQYNSGIRASPKSKEATKRRACAVV